MSTLKEARDFILELVENISDGAPMRILREMEKKIGEQIARDNDVVFGGEEFFSLPIDTVLSSTAEEIFKEIKSSSIPYLGQASV